MKRIVVVVFLLLLLTRSVLVFASESEYIGFELTVSNNTLLKPGYGLLLDIIPDKGILNPSCELPEITFTSPKQLTKTIILKDCIPKEANTFEVIIKRNPNWLKMIQERLKGTPVEDVDLLTNPKATIAIRQTYEIEHGEIENENDDEETALLNIGDSNSKAIDIDGRKITVEEIKNLLLTLGYLTNKDETTYTIQTNEDLAKLVKDYCLNKDKSNLKYQTTTIQGYCSYTEFKANKEDIKTVLDLNDFLRGLQTSNQELFNSIKENPSLATAILTFTIGAGVITTVSTTIDPFLPIVLAEFSAAGVSTQIDTLKTQLLTYSQENNLFKAGYIFGEVTKLIGLSGVITWASKSTTTLSFNEYAQVLKQVEELKTQNLNELSKLLYTELEKIAITQDETLQSKLKTNLNNFSSIVLKLTNEAKNVLNELVKRFDVRELDKSKIINKFGSLDNEARDHFLKITNRDNLAITLNDIELNDLLFVFGENVEEGRLGSEVIRVSKNLITGKPSYVPERGARVDLKSKIDDVMKGERSIANLNGETFLTDLNLIRGNDTKSLLNKLGLDTISDLKRFQDKEIGLIEFNIQDLDIKLPGTGNKSSFVKGGITSGGLLEAVFIGPPLSVSSPDSLLLVNGKTESLGILRFSENEIRMILQKSLNPPTVEEVDSLVLQLKVEGRL